jgi:filamentous hemagglutinin family protein
MSGWTRLRENRVPIMNRIFRSIRNDTGTIVAVSELCSGGGRKSSTGVSGIAPAENPRLALAALSRHAIKAVSIAVMLAFASTSNVHALPTGAAVVAGSATIAGGAGSMTINQATQNAAINWQSFSIGQSEAVRFVQPNSSSVALNRVLGADPSSILGSLSANGKVFLVNPNGILFGQGAQVNVGGLVASTMNITNADFMAGNYRFSGAGNGAVVNQGSITANGGYVALLGANVSNEGVISARLGTVALAAGSAATLDVAGDGLLSVMVNEGAINALAANGGLIRADGGLVLLSALSAGNLMQSAVNNTGVIQAQSIENHNGTIRLLGDMQTGTVNLGGTLDVSGTAAGQTGGSVTITAHHVGLFGANINASGDAGGGTVLVGGDFQGKNLHERGCNHCGGRHRQWQGRHGGAVGGRLDARLRQHYSAGRRAGR